MGVKQGRPLHFQSGSSPAPARLQPGCIVRACPRSQRDEVPNGLFSLCAPRREACTSLQGRSEGSTQRPPRISISTRESYTSRPRRMNCAILVKYPRRPFSLLAVITCTRESIKPCPTYGKWLTQNVSGIVQRGNPIRVRLIRKLWSLNRHNTWGKKTYLPPPKT